MTNDFLQLSTQVRAILSGKGYEPTRMKIECEFDTIGEFQLWLFVDLPDNASISHLSNSFKPEDYDTAYSQFVSIALEKVTECLTAKEVTMKKLMNTMEKARELSDDLDLPDEFRAQIEESIASLSTNILEKK